MTATPKRQSPGQGYAGSYETRQGTRWEWKATVTLPDGSRKVTHKRGFTSKKAAQKAMREALTASDKGTYSEPSKQALGGYLATWLDGLQLSASTVSSYRKLVRLHLAPYLGSVALASLTPAMLSAHYRKLETSGRQDGEGGLSYRTVRYVHTVLRKALAKAVKDGQLARNPAADADPPSLKAAQAPEMEVWTAEQLGAFLTWASEHTHVLPAWRVASYTGMRRGELLALRWKDLDLDKATLTVRRSVGVIREKGEGSVTKEGPTKTGKPRVVDLDPGTVATLKTWKSERGSLHLSLAQADALVFGDENGGYRHPERFSRLWSRTLARYVKALGEAAPPAIRLHDLRHTHATLLLTNGVPVHVVSQRLGHASPVITMTVYAHVLPGNQRAAAEGFAALVAEASN